MAAAQEAQPRQHRLIQGCRRVVGEHGSLAEERQVIWEDKRWRAGSAGELCSTTVRQGGAAGSGRDTRKEGCELRFRHHWALLTNIQPEEEK